MTSGERPPIDSAPETAPAPEDGASPLESTGPEPSGDRDTFDLLKAADHELVKKYQPKFLSRGGEHLVYEIPGHPNVVAKADIESLRRLLILGAENQMSGTSVDFLPAEATEAIDRVLAGKRARYQKMREIYGTKHVLPERVMLLTVPMTTAIRDAVFENAVPEPVRAADAKETWALVKIQRRAPELEDPNRFGIVSGYLEQRDPDPETYRRATRLLVEGDETTPFAREEFANLQGPPLTDLLTKADADPALRATLTDFVERTIQYTNETNEMLDLAGFDNVPVWQEADGTWRYRLVDALYPGYHAESKLPRAREALEMAAAKEPLDDEHLFPLLNAVNYVRTINGLAHYLGIPKRIDLAPRTTIQKVDLYTLLRQ